MIIQWHRVELPALLLLALGGCSIWAFAEIADAVLEGEAHAFDEAVIVALRDPADHADPLGPPWLEEMLRDLTALGGVAVLVTITLAVVAYLLIMQKRRIAVFVLAAVCGGLLLSTLFKAAFDRPRPELVAQHAYVSTASFPSGHSMMAAVTYLTLGALLARIHRRRAAKLYFLSLAALLTCAVGLSRIYLGVHWPTDVLAGWAAGASWAIACWLAALWLQQSRRVESTADEPGPA